MEIKEAKSVSSLSGKKSTLPVCFCDSAGNKVAPMEDAAELREKRKKDQKWVAKKIGVSVSMVSQYEHAKSTPSLWIAEVYAAALRVSLRRLVNALKESKRRAEAAKHAEASVTNLQAERERRQQNN